MRQKWAELLDKISNKQSGGTISYGRGSNTGSRGSRGGGKRGGFT